MHDGRGAPAVKTGEGTVGPASVRAEKTVAPDKRTLILDDRDDPAIQRGWREGFCEELGNARVAAPQDPIDVGKGR